MKILIVEDELLIQRSLKKMLEKKGAQVDAAASGKDALVYISKNKYDRIICDLMLQDITGFDVLEESKKHLTAAEIKSKFIIITAYTSAQVLDKAEIYGCKIISKPFNQIEQVIKIFLGEG